MRTHGIMTPFSKSLDLHCANINIIAKNDYTASSVGGRSSQDCGTTPGAGLRVNAKYRIRTCSELVLYMNFTTTYCR
jgi:hypothetical protein